MSSISASDMELLNNQGWYLDKGLLVHLNQPHCAGAVINKTMTLLETSITPAVRSHDWHFAAAAFVKSREVEAREVYGSWVISQWKRGK